MPKDVEKQAKPTEKTPRTSLKERILIFLDHYFGSLKLYLYSYPMPDGMWDNRKWRLKATGVQIAPPTKPPVLTDHLILISQRLPFE